MLKSIIEVNEKEKKIQKQTYNVCVDNSNLDYSVIL